MYIYRDEIVKKIVDVPQSPGPLLTAKNRHLFKCNKIRFDTESGYCYIYSTKKIPGLKEAKKSEVPKESKIRKEDYSKIQEVSA